MGLARAGSVDELRAAAPDPSEASKNLLVAATMHNGFQVLAAQWEGGSIGAGAPSGEGSARPTLEVEVVARYTQAAPEETAEDSQALLAYGVDWRDGWKV